LVLSGIFGWTAAELFRYFNADSVFSPSHPESGFWLSENQVIFIVAHLAMLVLALLTLGISISLFLRKKLPVWVYYIEVALFVTFLVVRSFATFTIYQNRICDGVLVDSCPSVNFEIAGTFILDLMICAGGAVAIFLIYRSTRRKGLRSKS
jgi:hypothetical protein